MNTWIFFFLYNKICYSLLLFFQRLMIGKHIFYRISYRLISHPPLDVVWTQSKWSPHPINPSNGEWGLSCHGVLLQICSLNNTPFQIYKYMVIFFSLVLTRKNFFSLSEASDSIVQ